MGRLGMRSGRKATQKKPDMPVLSEVLTTDATTPLIPEASTGARRRVKEDRPHYVPNDWDESLPYGGKVYLARRKLPDSWFCILIQVLAVCAGMGLVYYAWYHTDHMHFHLVKAYAHMGHSDAQATMGHKLLNGHGVEKNRTAAMEWFYKAAEQGHPQASYNLAIGHLKGHKTNLQPGDAHQLIKIAAEEGVPEAIEVLEKVCSRGNCEE
ncbi:hypothetical protein Pmani_026075 [Petrolisthes manimaculis]|uniref:Uncharacterized protein n=1 Tax=Petrolisthes manimaculis TaxID=1843537 RepID=A0AAE1P5G1_9EUCA|nr:hypothetical protein Pmani_026075 [Petrolisthes manimaculis]